MKKKELIEILAEKTQSNKVRTKLIFDRVWEVLLKVLRERGKVNIPSFGVFRLIDVKEGKRRNPLTGEQVWLERHKRISFRPSTKLKRQIREW